MDAEGKLSILSRPRRNRKSQGIRNLVRENTISSGELIYPLFIHDGDKNEDIESMPGCKRWSLDGLIQEVKEALGYEIEAFILFPAIAENLKSSGAEECYNPDGLVPRAIRAIKTAFPETIVITDVALDPYNSDGHDGIVHTVDDELVIENDETISVLAKQALCHAEAGADIVAPSDMMDGRVEMIREGLDSEGFEYVSIMSYSAKYASVLYGPFRGALGSEPKAGDKKTYQMDYANVREALREVELDEVEGADFIVIKPAGWYLDVISRVKEISSLPIVAYQVSGEFSMIEKASKAGELDRKQAIAESLMCIRRAGADCIITYYAKEYAMGLGD